MSESSSRLPARPSLDQLHKRAKELLKQYEAGERHAVERFRAVSQRFNESSDASPRLADAQFVLAREYGFDDWAKLREQVGLMRRSGPLFLSAKPPFYTIDWRENRLTVQGTQTEADWEIVFSVMKESQISGLVAGGLSDAALERLADVPGVTHLHIGGSSVTDAGMGHLRRMTQLQDLELGGGRSAISDRGLDALGELPELRRLQTCWTPGISDVGLAGLARCERLEDVNLLGTPTGDGAIRTLAGKENLRRFQSGRGVTDRGLELLAQIPVFRTWSGGEIRYGLMSADAGPNFLLIDGPFTDRGLAALAGLDGLFALSLFWHSPAFTAEGLAALKQLPKLGFLGCQGEHCDDAAMREIAAFPRLRMLMAQGAVTGDVGFEALSRSQSIEYLWGRDCPNLTGRGFAALAAMPALRGLAVSCKRVDDASPAKLVEFPSLRELVPMDVSDAGFRHVGRCENLEALWCMYCRDTGDAATEHIAGLSRLKSYYAGKTNITDRSLEILGGMAVLERLEFWQCGRLTDAGVAQLAGLPGLREIGLHGLPKVTRQAAAMFGPQMRVKYSE